jgi:hypothetical protein
VISAAAILTGRQMTKRDLANVGTAALASWSESDIAADPAGAMTTAMDAMRAALAGYNNRRRPVTSAKPPAAP